MKKLLISLLILIPIYLSANTIDHKISTANDFYKNKQYESSIELYEEIINSGIASSSVYYNLGNSYFRIGKLGLSVLNFEKAKKIDPNDEDIIHNLEFVTSRITDKVDAIPQFFLFGWWESYISTFTINMLTMICYILYLLIIILVLSFIFNKAARTKRKIFFTLIPTVVFMFAFIIALIGKISYESANEYAVIIESRISVKNSPDEKERDIFLLHEGLKIKIEDNVDKWVKIRLADGKVGWVEKSTVTKI
jgi:tetratricopeptide (TPR) repeat protein